MLTKEEIAIIETELTQSHPLIGMLPQKCFWNLLNEKAPVPEQEYWLNNFSITIFTYFLLILEAEGV